MSNPQQHLPSSMLSTFSPRKTLPPEVIDQIAKQLCLRGDTETLVDLALTNSTNYVTAMRWLFYSIEISVGQIERLSNQIKRDSILAKRVHEVSVFYDPSEQALPFTSILPNVTHAHIGVASFGALWQMWHQWKRLDFLHIGDIDFKMGITMSQWEQRPIRQLELSALALLDRRSLHAILKACPLLEVLKIDVGNSANPAYSFGRVNLFKEKDLHEAIWPKRSLRYLELYTNDGTSRLNMQTLCNGLNRCNITHLRVTSNFLMSNDVDFPSGLRQLEVITYSWVYDPTRVREFIAGVCMLAPEFERLHIVMQHDTRSWSSGWTPSWTHPPTLDWADGGDPGHPEHAEYMWTVDATEYILRGVRADAIQGGIGPDVHIDVVKIYATDSPQASQNLGGVYRRDTKEITLHAD